MIAKNLDFIEVVYMVLKVTLHYKLTCTLKTDLLYIFYLGIQQYHAITSKKYLVSNKNLKTWAGDLAQR